MSPLLSKASPYGREIVRVTPASAGWQYVGFEAYRLRQGEALSWLEEGRECCAVILCGKVDAEIPGKRWVGIGERRSVFDELGPYAVYVPPGTPLSLTALSNAEIAFCSAPSQGNHPARLIEPDTQRRSVRGLGSNTRLVYDILPQTDPADALLVVEVRTPASHSSSYPPHKHDRDALPEESSLEETYYHRINPSQGFAYQRVYTDDRSLDETMAAEDHDVVRVPRGYHPVTMPHGYEGYYLNVMAGPRRAWHFQNDPAHAWLMGKVL